MADAIKNVSDLCDVLASALTSEETGLVTGTASPTAEDRFAELDSAALIDENYQALEIGMNGTLGEVIASQEANAFLTGFSNSHGRLRRDRSLRWKRAHERTLLITRDNGVLQLQWRPLGTKTTTNFLDLLRKKSST